VHFASIPADVVQVCYLNHEAAPELPEVEDYFREVTLFKVNPALCSTEALRCWRDKSDRRWFFLGYENGKSAVRVAPGATAKGVHLFAPAPGLGSTVRTAYPCVLHYINCGFQRYRQKYAHRGAFSDAMFDRLRRLPFHLQSRDVAARGEPDVLRRFYEENVVFSDQREVDALVEAGLAVRLNGPRAVLQGAMQGT
jgi:hypothetical protein